MKILSKLGLAIGFNGEIIVADTDNNQVHIYSKDGIFLKVIGKHGSKDGEFMFPLCVAVYKNYNNDQFIAVSDCDNHRIQIFTFPDGKFHSKFGTRGTAPGGLNKPIGLAFDPCGNILLVDSENDRVQVFSFDGKFIHSFGSTGNDNGKFSKPRFFIY